jgi:hypothetical protein
VFNPTETSLISISSSKARFAVKYNTSKESWAKIQCFLPLSWIVGLNHSLDFLLHLPFRIPKRLSRGTGHRKSFTMARSLNDGRMTVTWKSENQETNLS